MLSLAATNAKRELRAAVASSDYGTGQKRVAAAPANAIFNCFVLWLELALVLVYNGRLNR